MRRLLLALALTTLSVGLLGCPGSAQRWTDRGDQLLRDNDLVGAEKAYNRAIASDPHFAPALYGKGWALYLSGHDNLVPAARQLFSRAIDYAPEHWAGYRGMGALLLDEGKVAPAERPPTPSKPAPTWRRSRSISSAPRCAQRRPTTCSMRGGGRRAACPT